MAGGLELPAAHAQGELVLPLGSELQVLAGRPGFRVEPFRAQLRSRQASHTSTFEILKVA